MKICYIAGEDKKYILDFFFFFTPFQENPMSLNNCPWKGWYNKGGGKGDRRKRGGGEEETIGETRARSYRRARISLIIITH